MSLTLEDFGRDYVLTLKGQMTHRVTLGKDPRGNLTRIDNAPKRYVRPPCHDAEQAGKPVFADGERQSGAWKAVPQEDELRVKSERLAELNIALNIDDKTPLEAMAEEALRGPRLPNLQNPLSCRSSIPTIELAAQNQQKA